MPSVPAVAAAEADARVLLVAPSALGELESVLSVARPLASTEPARELIVAGVVAAEEVGDATARLASVRERLLSEGVAARTAAFSSPDRARTWRASRPRKASSWCSWTRGGAALEGPAAPSSSERRATSRCW